MPPTSLESLLPCYCSCTGLICPPPASLASERRPSTHGLAAAADALHLGGRFHCCCRPPRCDEHHMWGHTPRPLQQQQSQYTRQMRKALPQPFKLRVVHMVCDVVTRVGRPSCGLSPPDAWVRVRGRWLLRRFDDPHHSTTRYGGKTHSCVLHGDCQAAQAVDPSGVGSVLGNGVGNPCWLYAGARADLSCEVCVHDATTTHHLANAPPTECRRC
jgi:hypothetical protein